MKGLRRSLGKDKSSSYASSSASNPTSPPLPSSSNFNSSRQTPNATLPPDLNSKQPPRKIIRALHAYRSRAPQELSFQKGDFFHVVGERAAAAADGDGWYDAANPATGARGLVPMAFFEELGRREGPPSDQRRSQAKSTSSKGGSSPVMPSVATMPSYASMSPAQSPLGAQFGQQQQQQQQTAMMAPHRAGPKAQSLYGRVLYDFESERPDELDAKKGEHIIVIAQSNHEWFVAKPIGRLGGPGLIPASFVEIMNMATGKAIDQETVAEMVRGGALPPVEEWKKTTAEYKQASIPLGRFDFGPAAQQQQQQPQPAAAAAPAGQNGYGHARQPSASVRQANSSYEPNNGRLEAYAAAPASQSTPALGQAPSPDAYTTQFAESADFPADPDELVAKYGILAKASVESFHQEEGSFWFHMRCAFTSDYSLVLYRLYEDFYDFQMALKDAFPVEAGLRPARPGDPPRRILPLMPGPTDTVNEVVCADRVVDLTTYLGELARLPAYLRKHALFFDFLLPRPGDVELSQPRAHFARPPPGGAGGDEAENEILDYLDSMPGAAAAGGLEGGLDQLRLSNPASRPDSRTSNRASVRSAQSAAAGGARSHPSSYAQPVSGGAPAPGRSSYNYKPESTHTSGSSSGAGAASRPPAPQPTAAPPQGFVKIKIFHRNTDDLIAIRVPPSVRLGALLDKTRERLGGDVGRLCFRDEGARWVELAADADLDRWLASGQKMVLYAD